MDTTDVYAQMMRLCPMVDPTTLRELAHRNSDASDRWRRQLTVSRSLNPVRGRKRVLAYTLFSAGRVNADNVAEVGLYERVFGGDEAGRIAHSFETRYLDPLLHNVMTFPLLFPGWVMRIYLEPDLEFLVGRLAGRNVEIRVMAETSCGLMGALWRFLPADDPDVECFLSGEADERLEPHQAETVTRWLRSGRTFFRFLGITPPRLADTRVAMEGGRWGARHDPALQLTDLAVGYAAFQRPENRKRVDTSGQRDVPGEYGFDESFLSHVVYYMACERGMFTQVPCGYVDDPASPTGVDLRYQRWRAHGAACTSDDWR